MKKSILLAGVACLFSFSANAMETDYMDNIKPYMGLDYVYTKADIRKDLDAKDKYNSGLVNLGMKWGNYFGAEAFFQLSDRPNKGPVKTDFYAYGIDLYGYMPMNCDATFSLLGSLGLAEYEYKVKSPLGNYDKGKLGYRMGLGAEYKFNDNWSARVMARYTYLDMRAVDNLQELSAGIRYTF